MSDTQRCVSTTAAAVIATHKCPNAIKKHAQYTNSKQKTNKRGKKKNIPADFFFSSIDYIRFFFFLSNNLPASAFLFAMINYAGAPRWSVSVTARNVLTLHLQPPAANLNRRLRAAT